VRDDRVSQSREPEWSKPSGGAGPRCRCARVGSRRSASAPGSGACRRGARAGSADTSMRQAQMAGSSSAGASLAMATWRASNARASRWPPPETSHPHRRLPAPRRPAADRGRLIPGELPSGAGPGGERQHRGRRAAPPPGRRAAPCFSGQRSRSWLDVRGGRHHSHTEILVGSDVASATTGTDVAGLSLEPGYHVAGCGVPVAAVAAIEISAPEPALPTERRRDRRCEDSATLDAAGTSGTSRTSLPGASWSVNIVAFDSRRLHDFRSLSSELARTAADCSESRPAPAATGCSRPARASSSASGPATAGARCRRRR
jgi:hypothetical protein